LNSASPGAIPIVVAAGERVQNIDIEMIRRSGVRVMGRLVPPTDAKVGRWYTNTFASLWPEGAPMEMRPMRRAASDARFMPGATLWPGMIAAPETLSDRFELEDVLPGRYVLEAGAYCISGDMIFQSLAGWRVIDVPARDLEGVEIALSEPIDVSGNVRCDENCPVVPVTVRYQAISSEELRDRDRTSNADGSILLTDMLPGWRFL
jgi:hypothetical protein